MDDEDKKKLDRVLALAEENNKYIRQVRSTQKTSQMIRAIYWVVIIVLSIGGYYFIKPYITTMTNLYSSGTSAGSGFQIPDMTKLQDLIQQLKQ